MAFSGVVRYNSKAGKAMFTPENSFEGIERAGQEGGVDYARIMTVNGASSLSDFGDMITSKFGIEALQSPEMFDARLAVIRRESPEFGDIKIIREM